MGYGQVIDGKRVASMYLEPERADIKRSPATAESVIINEASGNTGSLNYGSIDYGSNG